MSTANQDTIDSDEKFWPFEMGYLPEVFQKKAEMELNESAQNIQKGLKQMREMALRDRDFDCLNINDQDDVACDEYFIRFLRYSKFNVGNAFSRLKATVNLMKSHPELFDKKKFESMFTGARDSFFTFMPRRCPDGCVIWRMELDRWDPSEFPTEEFKCLHSISLSEALNDPMTQVNGFKIILAAKRNNLKHLQLCTPSNIYLLYHTVQVCTPGRFKEIHIISQSLVFKVAWLAMKPLLSKKLRERVIFHSGPETLVNYFPRSVLPIEYGGHVEDLDMTEWFRKAIQTNILDNIMKKT